MLDMVRRLAEVCKPVVETTARRRRTIAYEELARKVRSKVNLPELHGRDRLLHDALDLVSKDSYDGGQNLLLSAVSLNAPLSQVPDQHRVGATAYV